MSTSTVRVTEIQYSSTASTSTEYEYPSPAYRQISNISCTQSPNIYVSHLALQLPLPNPLKPDIKLIIQM